MKQTILHINIHGNESDVSSHHQEKPGCRCLPALQTHSCASSVKAVEAQSEQDVAWSPGGGSLALLANSDNHKITFLLSLSYTKRQVFFPSSAPSSFFFFFPQPHTIVCTIWWLPWSTGVDSEGQDSTPDALYAEYCTGLNCLLLLKMPPPPSFSQTGSQSVSGFFPPFTLPSTLTYFFLFMTLLFYFCLTSALWSGSTHFWEQPSEVANLKSTQLSNALTSDDRVLFWHASADRLAVSFLERCVR